MPQLFIFQYKVPQAGKEHPAVHLLSARFKNKDKATKWADKMQKQARDEQTKGCLPTFKVLPDNWKRPKNLNIPRNTNTGQAQIGSIKKLTIQRAH